MRDQLSRAVEHLGLRERRTPPALDHPAHRPQPGPGARRVTPG